MKYITEFDSNEYTFEKILLNIFYNRNINSLDNYTVGRRPKGPRGFCVALPGAF